METDNTQNLSIKEKVLQKINTQEVSMHSKKYFFLRAVLLIILVCIILLFSAALFNFIFFNIHINDNGYLLSFGPQGFWIFLMVFPWWLLIVDIIFVLLLERLLRNFRFASRTPVLYMLLGILFFAAVIGYIVYQETPLNDHFLHQADMHRLPLPLNNFYNNFRQLPPPGSAVCDCIVTNIEGTSITAYQKNNSANIVKIIVPINDPLLHSLTVGDSIFTAGNFHNGALYSFGIRKTPPPPIQ